MCDTLGRISSKGAFFAKNSDRSPNEAQILEYYPAKDGLSGMVECTYLSVPQVKQTYGVLLSRPVWMWGAEMGVNEHGLCIGNEAVFTKGAYGKTGLTGMDMVRLALERCASAQEAVKLLIELLERYGQGGNCGFDHDFYYDNAFLIMDRSDIYVLETAGRNWVSKRYDAASISNRLSIGAEGDAYSGSNCDFKNRYLEPVYSTFSGSVHRKRQTENCLNRLSSVGDCMAALAQHRENVKDPFAKGSVDSVCMHFGGLVGDHTTASMVVSLEQDRTVVWNTGSSCPCVSLFKPWVFGTEPVLPVVAAGDGAGEAYWMDAERFRRSLLGKKLPAAFYAERSEIQQRWNEEAIRTPTGAFTAFSRKCMEEEQRFFRKWSGMELELCSHGSGFRKRWNRKNAVLFPDGL